MCTLQKDMFTLKRHVHSAKRHVHPAKRHVHPAKRHVHTKKTSALCKKTCAHCKKFELKEWERGRKQEIEDKDDYLELNINTFFFQSRFLASVNLFFIS